MSSLDSFAEAKELVKLLDVVQESTRENASLGLESVVRPHPLVVLMSRDGLSVLVVPAIVWDRGRDMLAPFSEKLAQGSAMLVVLGHPTTADGRAAMSKGVASIVSGEPSHEEIFVAVWYAKLCPWIACMMRQQRPRENTRRGRSYVMVNLRKCPGDQWSCEACSEVLGGAALVDRANAGHMRNVCRT